MRTTTYSLGQTRIWTITTPPPPADDRAGSDGQPLTLVEHPETPQVRDA